MNELIRDTLCLIDSSAQSLEILSVDGCDEGSSGEGAETGLGLLVARRARGDRGTVILYGFDAEERVKQRPQAEILNAPGVFYLELPATLSRVRAVLKKAINNRLDSCNETEKRVTDQYARQQIRAFKHRCDNLWMSMQSDIVRTKDDQWEKRGLLRATADLVYVKKMAFEYGLLLPLANQLGIQEASKIPSLFSEALEVLRRWEAIRNVKGSRGKKALIIECVERIKTVSDILSAVKGEKRS